MEDTVSRDNVRHTRSIGGLIFAAVEHPNAVNNLKRKKKLLASLREDMAKKYNMSQDDFVSFIEITEDAVSKDGPSWGYFEGIRFAFETLTVRAITRNGYTVTS